ncbi:RDD family protein [Pseudomonas fuscovaginae UPB0736]|uniref:RDD family protein n=1 Tax=Pseudomonas asplenii TaxID=53407 RepID=UPI000288A27B|nr:RDD family protein [Pseudomonas fuscovaginae]UUQ64642.1 RDD family protein [Pseudomonas fuscovaginae UPB0736]
MAVHTQKNPSDLASPVRRLVAQIIDLVIVFLLICVIVLILSLVGLPSISSLLGIAVGGGYFLFSDAIWDGQSIGKKVMRISAVDEFSLLGCSYLQSFVRNFLKFFLLFTDWIFIFFESRKRLGDMLASTVVINAK